MVFARNATTERAYVDPLNKDTQFGCVFAQKFAGMLDHTLIEITALKRARPTTRRPTQAPIGGYRRVRYTPVVQLRADSKEAKLRAASINRTSKGRL
jgi:hypothetical protein